MGATVGWGRVRIEWAVGGATEVAGKLADGWMLLDVRTDAEWADGRIAGAVHIPMDQLMGGWTRSPTGWSASAPSGPARAGWRST